MIAYQLLTDALVAAPAQQPFVTLWHDEDNVETATFGEFREHAEMYARRFRDRGVQAGDTIILIMPQSVALMASFAGAMLLGAVPAILAYPNFKVEPVKYRSGLAGVSANLKARLIVVDDEFPAEFLECVSIGDGAQLVRGLGPQAPGGLHGAASGGEAGNVAFIQHSAGTTGLQKGVALCHAAVLRQISHLASTLGITSRDRVYSWLPLYHDMGLVACFILPMVCHLPVVMQSPTAWVTEPGTMLRLISEYRCTLSWVPNFTLQLLARRVPQEDRAPCDLSSLRALINCSEPVRAQSENEFLAEYLPYGLNPGALQSSYAMAENVFAVTQSGCKGQPGPRRIWIDGENLRDQHLAKVVPESASGAVPMVSSGRCLPSNEVRIVATDGQDLPDGQAGEILIRSDSLFNGYYNRDDLTKEAVRNGWYWSGDLGFLLEQELYVIGRRKDLIIVAGKNIYPQDVEEIVSSHPAIHDGRAIALGVYNPDLGTQDIVVVAEVEKLEDLDRLATIERTIKRSVVADLGVAVRAVYLKPPRWLVKSTAGKPARSTTREKLLAEHPELMATMSGVTAIGS